MTALAGLLLAAGDLVAALLFLRRCNRDRLHAARAALRWHGMHEAATRECARHVITMQRLYAVETEHLTRCVPCNRSNCRLRRGKP